MALTKPATVVSAMLVEKSVSSGNNTICAVLASPSKTTAAFLVPLIGRWNQFESPFEFTPCHVDLHFWLPESRTSKMSNSPQPESQHEHCPYWSVLGTCALRIQAAGISALKPVAPERGMLNSRRKSFDGPSNPSNNRQ